MMPSSSTMNRWHNLVEDFSRRAKCGDDLTGFLRDQETFLLTSSGGTGGCIHNPVLQDGQRPKHPIIMERYLS